MRIFSNFWNCTPHPLWAGLKPPQKSPIFKHFLIQLECWNFGCGLRLETIVLYKVFSIFFTIFTVSEWSVKQEKISSCDGSTFLCCKVVSRSWWVTLSVWGQMKNEQQAGNHRVSWNRRENCYKYRLEGTLHLWHAIYT